MDYFDCAYFGQTYFATDCAPAATGGRPPRGPRLVRLPLDPLLAEDEDMLWIT